MRNFDSLLFLGNGKASIEAVEKLKRVLDEAITLSGGDQQGKSNPRVQAAIQDAVQDIAAALTGRSIVFGDAGSDQLKNPEGPCQQCQYFPATHWWTEVARNEAWCHRCVLEAQIEHATVQVAKLPELQTQLAQLIAKQGDRVVPLVPADMLEIPKVGTLWARKDNPMVTVRVTEVDTEGRGLVRAVCEPERDDLGGCKLSFKTFLANYSEET